MADNYQQFSEEIKKLTPKEEKWLRDLLATPETRESFLLEARRHVDEEEDLDFSWSFDDDEVEGMGLWVYAEDAGNIEHVVLLVRAFLKKFRPKTCWTLEYADTCSRPRIGAFGGGAVLVTATDAQWLSTSTWRHDQVKKFEARMKRRKEKAKKAKK